MSATARLHALWQAGCSAGTDLLEEGDIDVHLQELCQRPAPPGYVPAHDSYQRRSPGPVRVKDPDRTTSGSLVRRDDCSAWATLGTGPVFLYSGRLPVPFIGLFLSRPGPLIYSEVTSGFNVCNVAVCDFAEVQCVNTH